MFDFSAATKPTLYFIGVTTSKSSIVKVFPLWAKELGLKDVEIKGIDLPIHAPAEDYRRVTEFLKNDPLSRGALVTTHKLDLYAACQDQFDYIDPFAKQLGEVSCLSKSGNKFCAHAKDPISSGLALEQFVPADFWKNHGGHVLLLGSGGSALAMSLYLTQSRFGDNVPSHITLTNRSEPRLTEAKKILSDLNPKTKFSYLITKTPDLNDAAIKALPPYSLIVNATGLGKDAPGSPTTDAVDYPENSLVWEINYRGDLVFMYQAQAQQKEKKLVIEDGWKYFIHGWTQVIGEVFHLDITGKTLDKLSDIALEIQGA